MPLVTAGRRSAPSFLGAFNESSLQAIQNDKEIEKLVRMFQKKSTTDILADPAAAETLIQHLPPPLRFRKWKQKY
jgi:hypothetical protein